MPPSSPIVFMAFLPWLPNAVPHHITLPLGPLAAVSGGPDDGREPVEEVRDQKIRRFHVGGHDSQLVIATRSGEIGFLLEDPAAWADAIRGQLPAANGLPRNAPIPDTAQPHA